MSIKTKIKGRSKQCADVTFYLPAWNRPSDVSMATCWVTTTPRPVTVVDVVHTLQCLRR